MPCSTGWSATRLLKPKQRFNLQHEWWCFQASIVPTEGITIEEMLAALLHARDEFLSHPSPTAWTTNPTIMSAVRLALRQATGCDVRKLSNHDVLKRVMSAVRSGDLVFRPSDHDLLRHVHWIRHLENRGAIALHVSTQETPVRMPREKSRTSTPSQLRKEAQVSQEPCPDACKTDVYEYETREGTFRVSKRALDNIMRYEGYGARPYIPADDGSSGITIGYGYDLGHQSPSNIAKELNGKLSPEHVSRLQAVTGLKGDAAKQALPSVSDIYLEKDEARELLALTVKRYAGETVRAFPGITHLHPHCQGALLSLVMNRGASMVNPPQRLNTKPSDRKPPSREHMRYIKASILNDRIHEVPEHLTAMKELWEKTGPAGLLGRRDDEAQLFMDGMTCTCWK